VKVAAVADPARVQAARIAGLDGVRGIAALYVVLNHIFERAWPGGSAVHAPPWAAWLDDGRLAVAVFITLSGFSLALGPARSGWRLRSIPDFLRRRAWRILPPYWAALAFSLVMVWFVVAQPGWAVPDGRSVVVYGLLVQDAVPAGIPNRAFWTIAIEAQLYLLLPLLLVLARGVSAWVMTALMGAAVVTLGLLAPHVPLANDFVTSFTPDLAVLFAVGVLAAGIVKAGARVRSLPWGAFALLAAMPPLALTLAKGLTWTNDNLFWLDLLWAPAIGCTLAALAIGRMRLAARVLDTRALRGLGSFSYSLYLTHMPIVIAVSFGLILPRFATGVPAFLVLVVVLVPLTIGFARLFAAAFELPFQRHRGWGALRAAFVALPGGPGMRARTSRNASNNND
jgi:peptidoglycan/LPS O-acetylase OafA/YrhL